MTKATSASQIIKRVGNTNLDLSKGDGYWYFTYDDGDHYDTWSVFTTYLSHMSLEGWINEADQFLEKVNADIKDRADSPITSFRVVLG